MKAEAVQRMMLDDRLWVFAYGSLLWKPNFTYSRMVVGYIHGFKRRFYQGNTNVRGSRSKPGRVAILVPDEQEKTWGVAYEIRGRQHVQHALEHLYVRENAQGGYVTISVQFHPRRPDADSRLSGDDVTAEGSDDATNCDSDNATDIDGDNVTDGDDAMSSDSDDATDSDDAIDSDDATNSDSDDAMDSDNDSDDDYRPFPILSFTATPDCEQWLGPADEWTMARQVVAARGCNGPCTEYVLRTADFVRQHIPEDRDGHLFDLERRVRHLMAAQPAPEDGV